MRKKSRTSSTPNRSITCYGPIGLPVQACSNLLNLHESSTADRPRRPMSFMGAELYISRSERRMLQVSKMAISGALEGKTPCRGPRRDLDFSGKLGGRYEADHAPGSIPRL